MGKGSAIGWTDDTGNMWHGCDKVSAGCKNCYAEVSTPVRVKRAKGLEVWGAKAARSETKSWEQNLRKWDREARASGKVHRVFAQSLSDTFEDYRGGRVVYATGETVTFIDTLLAAFFHVVQECSALTFQLLTKRPENVTRMVPASWLTSWPANVQIGTSVGDQETAEKRIPHLLAIPAAVRFLSVEPQIGPVDLTDLVRRDDGPGEHHYSALECDVGPEDDGEWGGATIAWVIQGGESGSKARSMREQCRVAGVPFFLKQLGANPRTTREDLVGGGWGMAAEFWQRMPGESTHRLKYRDSHGADESEWPADLRGCRAFPEAPHA